MAPPIHDRARSPWRLLERPVFRSLWVGSVVVNVATWMRDVAGAWLMTSLSPLPIMVALIQTATTLPFFLIGLPAGALWSIAVECYSWPKSGRSAPPSLLGS